MRTQSALDCQHCPCAYLDDDDAIELSHGGVTYINLKKGDCIMNYYDADAEFLINHFYHYQNNFLPLAGGSFNQPAVFMEAMQFIGIIINGDTK